MALKALSVLREGVGFGALHTATAGITNFIPATVPATTPRPTPPRSVIQPIFGGGGGSGSGGGTGNYWYYQPGPMFSTQRRPWDSDGRERVERAPEIGKTNWYDRPQFADGNLTVQNQETEQDTAGGAETGWQYGYHLPQTEKVLPLSSPDSWQQLVTRAIVERLKTNAAGRERERETMFLQGERRREEEWRARKAEWTRIEEERQKEWEQTSAELARRYHQAQVEFYERQDREVVARDERRNDLGDYGVPGLPEEPRDESSPSPWAARGPAPAGTLGASVVAVAAGTTLGAVFGGPSGAVAGSLFGGAAVNIYRSFASLKQGLGETDREAAISGMYAVAAIVAGAVIWAKYVSR